MQQDAETASRTAAAAAASVCPACGKPDGAHYHSHDGIDLHQCAACETVYMHPLPSAETIAGFYDNSYDGASTGYFAKVDKKMKRSRGRIKYLSRFVPEGAFLDIGSNGGFMVEAAREHGYQATGVEIDSVSVDYAREHYPQNEFFTGTVEEYADSGKQFDLAYCSEVIEHVPDVQGFVAATAKLLRPGAVLFVTTPDISHWRRPRTLTDWDAYCPPSHCVFFTPDSLAGLFDRHGFRVRKRRPAFKPGIKLVLERI